MARAHRPDATEGQTLAHAAERVAKFRAELEELAAASTRTETALQLARDKGDDAKVAMLRQERDAQLIRRTGMEQDVAWAERAYRKARETELLQAIARAQANLARDWAALWPTVETALRAVADCFPAMEALEPQRRKLTALLDQCLAEFHHQPAHTAIVDQLRLPDGFFLPVQTVRDFVAQMDQYRAWLGDAATREERRRLESNAWYEQRQADAERVAAAPAGDGPGYRVIDRVVHSVGHRLGFR
jgi:hypothetical protein